MKTTTETPTPVTSEKNDRPRFAIGHVNVTASNVDEMTDFYVEIGMRPVVSFGHMAIVELRGGLSPDEVNKVLAQVTGEEIHEFRPVDIIQVGRKIKPKTPGQHEYLEAIRGNELVFAIGPAGTGKTFSSDSHAA